MWRSTRGCIDGRRAAFACLVVVATFAIAGCTGCRKTPSEPVGQADPRQGGATVGKPQEDRYWESAREDVYKSVVELLTQHQRELAEGLKYDKIMQGDPRRRQVAMTFDDGPHPAYTPKLLEILAKHGAKATFFVVGEMAERAPELVKAEAAAGHDVGNHTYHHVNLTKIPSPAVATEIKACGNVVQQITGKPPHLFRPPGGDYNRHVAEVAEALGYTMVLWTDDPGDYASPGDRTIETRVLDRIGNGGIVLMHDGVQQTLDVLPQILDYLRRKGYRFVTVDEMMGRP
jgi:peptidoglycan/xylan/chitin deacetylase (PgdA/CDA1 family)